MVRAGEMKKNGERWKEMTKGENIASKRNKW